MSKFSCHVVRLALVLILIVAGTALAATKTFHENGKVESEISYSGDKIDQVSWFDSNGQLQTTEKFVDAQTKVLTFYTAQGLKASEETRINGKLTKLRTFHPGPGDKVAAESVYAADKLELNRFFDPNGVLQSVESFVDAQTRIITFHNAKGQKTSEETHVNGKRTKMRTFYPNGSVESEYSLKNEALDGKYQLFFENGKLKAEYDYRDGKQI